MWKYASRGFKSVFCKNQYSHNTVPSREAREGKNIYNFLRLSPLSVDRFNSNFGSRSNDNRQFARNKQKCDTNTDERFSLNRHNITLILHCGIAVAVWSITYFKSVFCPQHKPSNKFPYNFLTERTKKEYLKLLNCFSQSAYPVNFILPEQAAKPRGQESVCGSLSNKEFQLDELEFHELEKAHERVLGSLSNIEGAHSIEKGQYPEAFYHFQKGAELHNCSALFNLGVCHEMGWGTKQDLKKAAELYEKASGMGHPTAMYNLGVFYVHGLGGLKTDINEARRLFTIAASLGQPNAKTALDLENCSNKDLSENSKLGSNINEQTMKTNSSVYNKPSVKMRKPGKCNLLYRAEGEYAGKNGMAKEHYNLCDQGASIWPHKSNLDMLFA